MVQLNELREIGTRPTDWAKNLRLSAASLILVLWALVVFLPLAWMGICAFTPNENLLFTRPVIRFEAFSLDNLRSVFRRSNGLFDNWLFNSFYIALVVSIGSTFLSAMAGYSYAKMRFPGRQVIFWILLATLMVPYQAIVIPLFVVVNNMLRLADSHWAIILPQLAAPAGVFFCRQYMKTLPSDLEDAARIDGCSEFGIFCRVILPVSRPVLAATAIFTFLWSWESFFWPLVILRSEKRFVLQVGLAYLQDNSLLSPGYLMAGALAASIPVVLFFIVFQRQLTKGFSFGGLQG